MSPIEPSQVVFETCYRGRQSAIHHAAYTRMQKVLLALAICRKAGLELHDIRVMDYGFGAGTFFRYCAPSCSLSGVEIDPANVSEVQEMLRQRGYPQVDLQVIDIKRWSEHPLLDSQYDCFLCSHVLEHLLDPVDFLRTIKKSLAPSGKFVGLVPLNERRPDLHHLQTCSSESIYGWARDADMRIIKYVETDHFLYWAQPWLIYEQGLAHKIGQAVSLSLGLPATFMGPRPWFTLSRTFSVLTRSKPTQAAFILELV
jgi:2-polyprenyl-3-methyl-5-hydroxy-6-metoxy-1,4-benzoquinol methylase